MMKSEQLKQEHIPICPHCLKGLDGFTSTKGQTPRNGDVSICLYCNSTLEFINVMGQLHLQPVSDDALEHTDFVELGRGHDLVKQFHEQKDEKEK